MNIREFSQELQKIYEEMSKTFSDYQQSTGLTCLEGCGRCCVNPEVEASVFEMIPLALRLYDENKLEEWLEKLDAPLSEHCLLFQSHTPDGSKGLCGAYQERPSLCRMFGVSGYHNKHQQITLSICKYIREKYPDLTKIRMAEASGEKTPMLMVWSYRLAQIDPALIQERMPINRAIKGALEKVALYALYQGET